MWLLKPKQLKERRVNNDVGFRYFRKLGKNSSKLILPKVTTTFADKVALLKRAVDSVMKVRLMHATAVECDNVAACKDCGY